jgi:hypothetical protein
MLARNPWHRAVDNAEIWPFSCKIGGKIGKKVISNQLSIFKIFIYCALAQKWSLFTEPDHTK